MERAVIIVNGRVQKAGYRDLVDEAAFNLDLVGRVKNIGDGSVEIVCEGPKDKIREFTNIIQIKQYPIKVESIEVKYSKATGEYKEFEVVREEDVTTATYERMDTAARYMREMNQNLGEKMDHGFSEVNQSINSLDKNICSNFDHLDKKYDKISDRMERIDKTLEKLADAILQLAKK